MNIYRMGSRCPNVTSLREYKYFVARRDVACYVSMIFQMVFLETLHATSLRQTITSSKRRGSRHTFYLQQLITHFYYCPIIIVPIC